MLKDILAEAAFTAAVHRLTRAAPKAGISREEAEAIFAAVIVKVYGRDGSK